MKIIPELRFPEFEGEWEKKPLGYFCNYWNGSGNEGVITEDGGYYLISLNSIDIEGNLKSEMKMVAVTDNSLKKGDLVMVLSDVAHGNFLGLTAIIPNDSYVLNQRMAGLGIKDFKKIDGVYLRLFINANQSYFKKQGQGSSQQNLSKGSVVDFPVLVPSQLAEQQKIASCLSSLDEVIAAHSQKLELLKDHKKGLMQNLFPQEGEKVPKLRFKEFEQDGEWVEKSIEEIAKVSAGGTPQSTKPEYWNGDIPWMNSGELNNKRIYSVSNFITVQGLENSSTKLIPPRCVLIGLAGQGKTRGTAAINYIELCTNQSIGSIHPNELVFDSEFLYHKIDSMYEKLRSLSTGDGGRGGLNLQIIKEIKVLLPSIKEQQKIASCLSYLDALITAQAEKIEQLKWHKKGLMQGLFPKIND